MKQKQILNKLSAYTIEQLLEASQVVKVLKKENIPDDFFLLLIDDLIEEKKEQVKKDGADCNGATTSGKTSFRKLSDKGNKTIKPFVCPSCKQKAFRQSICSKCAKGRAGIKSQYICGDCNFVFYI
ncbi:hypothetical protein [Desulfotignum phosphitoxidans]|uniref:Uncharacterized protein n=1 Tax=Desulfotignum phosphitoxidans DSM 13687 TaxID=1286635 RepID=S0FWY7_9BACT|nr:hypothetical protein [Desulfotignum phosphitoxidans]EMS79215.1 hypothetical protein Dpo_5c01380 [Desulfotignum phosphitoxidans DSM 13687]